MLSLSHSLSRFLSLSLTRERSLFLVGAQKVEATWHHGGGRRSAESQAEREKLTRRVPAKRAGERACEREREKGDRQIRRWICILIRNLSESSSRGDRKSLYVSSPPRPLSRERERERKGRNQGAGCTRRNLLPRASAATTAYPPVLFLPHYAGLASSTCRTYRGAKLFLRRGLVRDRGREREGGIEKGKNVN